MVTSLLHDPYVASEILFPDGKLHPWTRMAFVNLPKKATIFLFFLNVISCAMEAFEVRFSPLSVHRARDVNCIQTFPSPPLNLCLALLKACR